MSRSREDDPSFIRTSASSDDDMSQREENKDLITQLEEIIRKVRMQQSEELSRSLHHTREMRKQLMKLTHDTSEMGKQLENLIIDSHNDLRKLLESRINHIDGHDSAAPRSQLNQVHPPRYRLVFKSGHVDKIEKGQSIEISVALVDGSNNDQTVENGPLASAIVELVVVDAEFNQHGDQYNWSRADFLRDIVTTGTKQNSVQRNVDHPAGKSIVSNGRFNLCRGVRSHSGSTIIRNSSNKKVRLGVMVVFPTEERVLEGLSNPFFVRGHDRPNRPKQKGPMPTMLTSQWTNLNSTLPAGTNNQEQKGSMPTMLTSQWTNLNSTLLAGTNNQGLIVNNGRTSIVSAQPSTSQEHQDWIHQNEEDLMMFDGLEDNQIDTFDGLEELFSLGEPENIDYMYSAHEHQLGEGSTSSGGRRWAASGGAALSGLTMMRHFLFPGPGAMVDALVDLMFEHGRDSVRRATRDDPLIELASSEDDDESEVDDDTAANVTD